MFRVGVFALSFGEIISSERSGPQWRVLRSVSLVYICVHVSQTEAVIIPLPFDAPNLIDLILIGLFHLGFQAFKDASMSLSANLF